MKGFAMRSEFSSTSAEGGMLATQVLRRSLLEPMLYAGAGTSSGRTARHQEGLARSAVQTSAGAPVLVVRAGAAIAELRRLSGLSWDQLARLFEVSRRSLHFWASGKAMQPSNEEHLQRLLAVLRQIDRGAASANRSALLAVNDGGEMPFDLLVSRQYERAITLLGPGESRRMQAPQLSAAALAARAPQPPDELIGALQDRVHPSSGRLLAAKPVRIVRSK